MSRIGMAATLLRDGKAPEEVSRAVKLPLLQVQSIAREVEAALAKERAVVRKPRKPHLTTDKSEAIRRQIAAMPKPEPVPKQPLKRGDSSPEEDRHLDELVNGGFKQEEIAEILGRPYHWVTRRCSDLEIRQVVGPRAALKIRCIYKARYYLRRGDHLTALHVIEQAIQDHEGGKSC